MKTFTIICNNSKGLNKIFTIQGLVIPRFGDNADAINFDNDADAIITLNKIPKSIRDKCSLQKFVF